MKIFGRKDEPAVQAAKKQAGDEMMALFAVVILVIIAAVVISLRFLGVDPYPEDTENYTLNELFEMYGYDEQGISERLRPRLDAVAIQSESEPYAARDGELRYAYISKPEGVEPFPAVVLLHASPAGERVAERFSQEVAERLAEDAGVFTVAVDWRDSDFGDGDLTDSVSVLDAVEKYTVDVTTDTRKPIIYVGVDHGAYLALLAAAAEPELITAVATVAGYWDLEAQYTFLLETNPEGAATFLRDSGCDAALDSTNCLQQRSITEDTLNQVRSLMMIHHEDDPLVSIEQARSIVEIRNLSGTSFQETHLETLSAGDVDTDSVLFAKYHNLLEDSRSAEFEETYELLYEWIQEQLNPSLTVTDSTEGDVAEPTTPLEIDL